MKQYSEFKSDYAYRKYMRNYYAGLAMAALCKNSNYSLNEIKQGGFCDIAEAAFILAEEMTKRVSTTQYDEKIINKL